MSWHVEVLHRDGTVLSHARLGDGPVTIGRAADCDLVVDDPHVAARHVRVWIDSDDQAVIEDLGTLNGIRVKRGKRLQQWRPVDAEPFRLGHTSIRIRSTRWPLAAERSLQSSRTPVFAGLALTGSLAAEAASVWLGDAAGRSAGYLPTLSGILVILGLWSGAFALLGRLLSGQGNFSRHLLIACTGLLTLAVLDYCLDTLAFAFNWLLPLQLSSVWMVALGAAVLGFHLHAADPRHWKVMRWIVGGLALAAIALPVAQTWQSQHRWTTVDRIGVLQHPALVMTTPVAPVDAVASLDQLRTMVLEDKARAANDDNAASEEDEDLELAD